METIFAEEVVSEMAGRARGDGNSAEERAENERGAIHSTFWRNDDASNMSPTDIPAWYSAERELSTGSSCISVSILHRAHLNSLSPPLCPPLSLSLSRSVESLILSFVSNAGTIASAGS